MRTLLRLPLLVTAWRAPVLLVGLRVVLALMIGLGWGGLAVGEEELAPPPPRRPVPAKAWRKTDKWQGTFHQRYTQRYTDDYTAGDEECTVDGTVLLDRVVGTETFKDENAPGGWVGSTTWEGKLTCHAMVSKHGQRFPVALFRGSRSEDFAAGPGEVKATLALSGQSGKYTVDLRGPSLDGFHTDHDNGTGKVTQRRDRYATDNLPGLSSLGPGWTQRMLDVHPGAGPEADGNILYSHGLIPRIGKYLFGRIRSERQYVPTNNPNHQHLETTCELSWRLWPVQEQDLDVLVDLADYSSWLPKGSLDDPNQPGNPLRVKATLAPKPGKPPITRKAYEFRFTMVDVSREPGVCMNWPTPDRPQPINPDDLRFTPGPQPGQARWGPETRTLVVKSTSGRDAVADLFSYDFGGYGVISVTAVLEDGSEVQGHLRDEPDAYDINVPKREGSYIADWWLKDPKNGGGRLRDEDDDEVIGGSLHPGDGLSVYEEYRGFSVMREHVRTDPTVKTLFVQSIVPNVRRGLNLLQQVSGLQILKIRDDEYVSNAVRLVNPNHSSCHVVDQHGLWVALRELSTRVVGISRFGPPKYIHTVAVSVDEYAKPGADLADLADTIAHEMCHALCVPHHGYGSRWGKIKWPNGDEETKFITRPGSEHSGAQECIMRYYSADYIERGAPGTPMEPYGPAEPRAHALCLSAKATGVNAPPKRKCGNAVYGGCARLLTVSDIYPHYVRPQ